jgi:tetratricopeptide (TPR) repeat protein
VNSPFWVFDEVDHNQAMKRATFTLLLVIFLTLNAAAQAQTELVERIRQDVQQKNWEAARTDIEKLRTTDAATFQSGAYVYLLGRLAEESGNSVEAVAQYRSALNTQLSGYALWRLAQLAHASGDLTVEREHLRRLLANGPPNVLYDAASLRLAESYFESSDFNSVIQSTQSLITSRNIPLAREAMTLLAAAYLQTQKKTEARDVYVKLLMQMPDASRPDDFALTAVRELDELEKTAPIKLTEAEYLLRASVYHFNRDFKGARIHYQAVVDNFPQNGTVPNALYQLGRGYYLESNYAEAIKLFQRVIDQHPQTTSARDAFGFLAASHIRMGRHQDAVNAYQQLLQRFPDVPNPERIYLNIIDALHEAGRYADALNWVQQSLSRFKNDLGGALALFAQLRIHLAQAQWSEVIKDANELLKYSDLGGTRVPGGTSPVEVNFLRAFALEQMGNTEDAISAYLAIPDGRNDYYGARATQRLHALAQNDRTRTNVRNRFNSYSAPKENPDESRKALQTKLRLTADENERKQILKSIAGLYQLFPAYKLPTLNLISLGNRAATESESRGALLWKLGLYDEAMPEFFQTPPTANTPADESYTIAVYALSGGYPNRTVRFAEQMWRSVPADYVIDVAPRELVQLLYPAPFRSSLVKHGQGRNVDPRFVLSIARQESRYQTDAKSVAAARGMMQFIPSTANEMADSLKLKDFKQTDLYNVDTAVLFGSEYLRRLFHQFPNQPQAVAGSYNGGADNLARWIARSKSDEADRYVPEIGFTQSKDYVYKVMANFWNYQKLYDAQLNPRDN